MLISPLIMHSRLLAQHPDVLAKLRGEISSIVGAGKESRLPDRNALKKMKYLNLVFKEGVSVLPSPDEI
jgi:cytochrome P450